MTSGIACKVNRFEALPMSLILHEDVKTSDQICEASFRLVCALLLAEARLLSFRREQR